MKPYLCKNIKKILDTTTNKTIEYQCWKNAVVGCDYCSEHSCPQIECNSNASCIIHIREGCQYQISPNSYCKQPCVGGSNYCINHKCDFSRCGLMKASEWMRYQEIVRNTSKWCELHKCKAQGCGNVRNKTPYCESHFCEFDSPQCEKQRYMGGNPYGINNLYRYCEDHTCSACSKLRIDGSIYCEIHKCSECNEHKICKYHICGICYENNKNCRCEGNRCIICNSSIRYGNLCSYHKCIFCENIVVSDNLCKIHKCSDCGETYKCKEHYATNIIKMVRTFDMIPKDIQNIILGYIFREEYPYEKSTKPEVLLICKGISDSAVGIWKY